MIELLKLIHNIGDELKPINWFLPQALFIYVGLIIARRSAAIQIGTITLILTPLLLLPFDYLDAYNPAWYIKGLLWPLVYILSRIQTGISKWEAEAIHQKRKQQVEDLKEKIAKLANPKDVPPYFLFLKPSAIQHLDTQTEGHFDLEDILQFAIHPIRLIRLEKPIEMIDTQQPSLPNSEWQAMFAKFATHARSILLIPHPDTLGEIEWLVQHKLLPRSIWLMPETPGWSSQYFNYTIPTVSSEAEGAFPSISVSEEEEGYDFAANWNQAVDALKVVDIQLPPYQARGMFFMIDDNGTASTCQLLALSPTAFRAGKIRQALRDLHDPQKSSKENAYAPLGEPGLFRRVKETLPFTVIGIVCIGYGLYQEFHSGFSWSILALIVFSAAFLIPLISEVKSLVSLRSP